MATTTYSVMARFAGKNLIKGKLTWSTITTNKNYSPYADEILAYINAQGYMIDDDGNCVEIPDEEDSTEEAE